MNLEQAKKKIEKLKQQKITVSHLLEVETASLAKNEDTIEITEQAQTLIQNVAQTIQQQVHDQIAAVVSRCLEAVFEEPYKFNLSFEQRRGRTEADLTFERNGHQVDPLTASGGGVVDVAAFALRLSCLMLSKPHLRKLIVMDEPFKFVSVQYRDNVRLMMEQLSEDFGIQFVIITHMDELKMGKIVGL